MTDTIYLIKLAALITVLVVVLWMYLEDRHNRR
jgi:hypothetical protein